MEFRSSTGSDRRVEGRDADVDLRAPAHRREWTRRRSALLTAISIGGVLGAQARYGVDVAVPVASRGLPLATLLVNATGCLLIGILMVTVEQRGNTHPMIRAFLGVGVLGGYTTFSTYTLDIQKLLVAGQGALALDYLAATVVAGLVAVFIGVLVARLAFAARRRDRHRKDLVDRPLREEALATETGADNKDT